MTLSMSDAGRLTLGKLLYLELLCFGFEGFDHQVAVIAVRVIMLHSVDDNIAKLFVEQLRGFVPDAHFQTDSSDTALDKAAFHFVHHQPGKPSPSELGRDPDCGHVAGSVRLDHS